MAEGEGEGEGDEQDDFKALSLSDEEIRGLKVAELKQYLSALGLSTRGTKADLVQGLTEAIAGGTAAELDQQAVEVAPTPVSGSASKRKMADAEDAAGAATPSATPGRGSSSKKTRSKSSN